MRKSKLLSKWQNVFASFVYIEIVKQLTTLSL